MLRPLLLPTLDSGRGVSRGAGAPARGWHADTTRTKTARFVPRTVRNDWTIRSTDIGERVE